MADTPTDRSETVTDIAAKLSAARDYLGANRDDARYRDSPASAVI